MKVKHICFIVPNYPYKEEMTYTFVKQLIEAIANKNIKCTVIAAQSLTNKYFRGNKKRPFHWQDITNEGNIIDIYQPNYLSFSNIRFFRRSISTYFYKKATENLYKEVSIKPDVIYAHFWECGVVAAGIAKKNNIPAFVATGESVIPVKTLFTEKDIEQIRDGIKGVISVSKKNKHESIDLGLAVENEIEVIPNSIDKNKFYHIDKESIREELGFNKEDFIIAYTGSFSHRKGIKRVSKAVNKLENIKTIYIGSGNLKPQNEGILFIDKLPHEKIVKYLNAADAFVLPTLAEGCSNAIVEAMACGLPIISSNLPFNDDILDDTNSIRIDPNDILEISNAIKYLRDHENEREKMSKSSLKKAESLTIKERAEKIIKFIETKVGKC